MEEAKTFITNFNEKNEIVKTKSFYILLAFLLIITALLIAVSIYCYLIKYKAKEKHLLPFYVKNNKSKELLYCQCKLKISNKFEDVDIKTAHITFSMIL